MPGTVSLASPALRTDFIEQTDAYIAVPNPRINEHTCARAPTEGHPPRYERLAPPT